MNRYADRRASAVAILSTDQLPGALLAAAVELLGYRVEFPRVGESATDLLARLRPAALMIAAEHDAAHDEPLLRRALMAETRVYCFGSETEIAALEERAPDLHVEHIVFPRDAAELRTILSRREKTHPTRGGVSD